MILSSCPNPIYPSGVAHLTSAMFLKRNCNCNWQLGVAENREYVSRRCTISKHTNSRAISSMADSEFSSVHWDSPPPSSHPDASEIIQINNNGLMPTSPPTQSVPPEMDPLQAPPSNEHTMICVSP